LSDEEKQETELVEVSKPPSDLVESQDDIEEVEERFRRRRIDLSDDDKGILETYVQRIVEDWYLSRTGLVQKLRDWNELYEGVETITDQPWPGASSLHIPLPKIKAREIRSVIMRSSMRPIPFLLTKYAGPDTGYESSRDFVESIEDFVEDKIKNDTNVHETLKEAIIPAYRDGFKFKRQRHEKLCRTGSRVHLIQRISSR